MKIIIAYALLLLGVPAGYCSDVKYYVCEDRAKRLPHTSVNDTCAINPPAHSPGVHYPDSVTQGFVAACDNIYSVSLQLVNTLGWSKFEVLDSSDSHPGGILATAWVGKDYCGIGHSGFLTIPVGDIKVERGAKYYIRGTRRDNIFAVGATYGDAYKDGQAIGEGFHAEQDIVFVVSSRPREIPYLREVAVSTTCVAYLSNAGQGNSGGVSDSQSGDGNIGPCDDYKYIYDEEYISTPTVDSISVSLLSTPEYTNPRVDAQFRALSPDDKVRAVKKIYSYMNDLDPDISRRAKEILSRRAPITEGFLPELLKDMESGPPEMVYIFRNLGGVGAEVVQFLKKLARERHSIPAAVVLIGFGVPEGTKALGYSYFVEMKKVAKQFAMKDFVFKEVAQLPQGCILREFLPEHLSSQIAQAAGNGIQFGYTKNIGDCENPSQKCKAININDGASVLGRKIHIPDINYILLQDCKVQEGVAKEIRGYLGIREKKNDSWLKYWE